MHVDALSDGSVDVSQMPMEHRAQGAPLVGAQAQALRKQLLGKCELDPCL
jgi:hypothetical protein